MIVKGKAEQQSEIVDVDEYRFTRISDKGKSVANAISVEEYYRDLQSPTSASLHKSQSTVKRKFVFIDLESEEDEDRTRLSFSSPSIYETGQSSKSRKIEFVCDICVESKQVSNAFRIKGCNHAYCTDCIAKYVGSKLQDNIAVIICPETGCGGYLELEYCQSILPKDVFDRWGELLCEGMIIESQKFYCPFKDCSALMIHDGGEIIKKSECLNCRRLFCAQCKVSWHSEINCEMFQELHKDEREKEDIMLMNLSREKKWARCPNCGFFIEKISGCEWIQCRCGKHFNYPLIINGNQVDFIGRRSQKNNNFFMGHTYADTRSSFWSK